MHHKYPRPLLALLLLILASLACAFVPADQTITKGAVSCRASEAPDSYLEYVSLEYNCYCPNGRQLMDPYKRSVLNKMSDEELAQLCANLYSGTSRNIPSSAGSTEPSTEEPAPTEPPLDPAPLKPFLTEEFTSCDNVAGYVNFTIAEDAPAYDPATLKVTFNGYPVTCMPAASNPKILSCLYPPASYAPPAGVQVFIGEELVNEFDFNGGKICDPAPQPKNNTDPDPTEEPAPTADPGGSG